MEKKIVVPEGMIKAARGALAAYGNVAAPDGQGAQVEFVLIAALLWLSENPIVPTDEQYSAICHAQPNAKHRLVEWQLRMFLAPEPVGVDDLLLSKHGCTVAQIDDRIREAYRRGQQSR